jgi:hypothetical protein
MSKDKLTMYDYRHMGISALVEYEEFDEENFWLCAVLMHMPVGEIRRALKPEALVKIMPVFDTSQRPKSNG